MRSTVTVNQIKTWEQHYFENKRTIPSTATALFRVDNEINRKVSLWEGDITSLQVDAIVNAAKSKLDGGGGVDGAIHKAAGPGLKEESEPLGPIRPGTAVITGGHNLPAAYVIHAVGPRDKDPNVLRSAYESSLNFTATHPIRTIAFPSISTGIYGFPPQKAAPNACEVVRIFLERNKNRIDRIIFVVFGNDDKTNYEIAMSKYFPIVLSHASPTMGVATPRITASSASSPATSTSSVLSTTSSGSEIAIPTASRRPTTTASSRGSHASIPSTRSGRRIVIPRLRLISPMTSAMPTTSPSSLGLLGSIPSAYPARIALMTSIRPISSSGSLGSIRFRMMPSGSRRPRILLIIRHSGSRGRPY